MNDTVPDGSSRQNHAFLESYAGPESRWALSGHEIFDKPKVFMATSARSLGDVLRAWAGQVEAGLVVIPQAQAEGARAVASTDLMEQVRMLNENKTVSPAAPIVLAGAALEIALQSAIEELGLQSPDKHSISAYSDHLRTAGVLNRQDVKEVVQMGGLRNAAAHGDFNDLDRARAGLMGQQVNMFLRRLAEIIESRTATSVPALAD